MSLLRMENILGQQLSGVGDDELEWITTESMDRYLYEDYELSSIRQFSDSFAKRFEEQEIDIDAQIDEELRKIELTMPSK